MQRLISLMGVVGERARRSIPRAGLALTALVLALPLPASSAGSVDEGRLAFNRNCLQSGCHFEDATAPKYVPARFNADYLTFAFQNNFIMAGNLQLGSQTINDIATYIGLASQGQGNANDTDRMLNWAEDTFPQLLSPKRSPTQQISGYTYRFYAATGFYVATKDGSVFALDSKNPGAGLLSLGSLRSFLNQMPNGR